MSDAQHSAALAAWQRWRMDELGSSAAFSDEAYGAASNVDAAADELAEEARALAKLRESVRREAFALGQEEGRKAGYADGQTQGYADGVSKARAEADVEVKAQTQAVIEPLRNLLASFAEAVRHYEDALAEQVVDLALDTGAQLARRELDLHPEHLTALVRELLQLHAMQGNTELWLSPSDLTLMREHLFNELNNAGWELRPDATLTRGGCRLTSNSGELDASWELRCKQLMVKHLPSPNDVRDETRKPRSRRRSSARGAIGEDEA